MHQLHTLDGDVVVAVPAELALYPFGVFTTFVAVDGRVLGWREHVARLARDARALWDHELDAARLAGIVRSHLARLDGPATVRVTLYPDDLTMASPANARGCRTLVSSGPAELPFRPQSEFSVRTVEYERELAEVKSTALFGQIRLRREAQLAGYDDVLFRSGDEVLEGATWTVMSWRDGEIATPDGAVLASITAQHVGRIGEAMGWRSRQRPVRLGELGQAQLVLAVNANSPARAIRRIDDELMRVDETLLTAVADAYSSLPRDLVAVGGAPGDVQL